MGRHGENIRKRKDGRWEARAIASYDMNGKAKYRSFYGKTYLEAKEKKNRFLKDVFKPPIGKKGNLEKRNTTMAQVMEEWLRLKKDDVKESTFVHYTKIMENHILPSLGNMYISSLTLEKINAFLKNKMYEGRIDGKGGLSAKTVMDIRSVLLLVLKYAHRQGYPCPVDLGSDIYSPKYYKPAIKVLTKQEQYKLERFLYGHPNPASLGVLTTLYSGLRIGEICALQWRDVHFESGTIEVSKTMLRIQNINTEEGKTRILITRPKTENSHRLIPLPSFLIEILDASRQSTEIFLITGTKGYMEPRIYLEKYKKMLKQAGLNGYTFHALRHTFATRCVENGFDTKSLSEILGHANVNTTLQRYVHPSLEQKKEQMERLGKTSVWGQNKGTSSKK